MSERSELEHLLDGAVDGAPADPGLPLSDPIPGLESQLPTGTDEPFEEAPSSLERALDALVVPNTSLEPRLTPTYTAVLVVVRGKDPGRAFGLRGEPVLIGRAKGAQIRLENPTVSTRHAVVEQRDGSYWLEDLGSANGTLLNGVPIAGRVQLATSDQIEIVDTVLLFSLGDEAASLQTVVLEPHRRGGLMVAPRASGMGLDSVMAPTPLSAGLPEEREATFEEQLQKVLLVLAYARRHWRVLVGLPAVCGALGIASLAIAPPPGRAELTISLTPLPQENPLAATEQRAPRRERQFFHEANRSFAEARLVQASLRELGETNPAPEVVEAIAEELSFVSVTETLFLGQMTHSDPSYAVRFLEVHLDNYLQSEIDKMLRVYQAEVELLQSRVQDTETRLDQSEDQLRRFREANLRHLPEFAEGRVAAAGGLEGRAGDLAARVSRIEGELKLAKQRLARESPLTEARARAASPYQEAMAAANRRLAELEGRGLGADHPDVRHARQEIENLKGKAEVAARTDPTEFDRAANPDYTRLKDRVADLEVELTAARAELGVVGGQLGSVDETLRKLPGVEAELTHLTRNLETDRTLHARLIERLRQAQTQLEIERAAAQARYEIIVPPHSVGIAIRRTLATRVGIGFFLGLVIAVAWAVGTELLAIMRRLPRVQIIEQRPALPSRRVARG